MNNDPKQTETDEALWQQTVADVSPLPPSNQVPSVRKSARFKGDKCQTVPLRIFRHDVSLGTVSDIDRNTMRRFKREEFPTEGVLDLHGYNEDRAFEAVHRFMTQSYLAGKRCVIIVTGKGSQHQDEDIFAPKGVLKDRVPQWLESDELRQLILTYIHPSERLGGKGALYILLRRHRDRHDRSSE